MSTKWRDNVNKISEARNTIANVLNELQPDLKDMYADNLIEVINTLGVFIDAFYMNDLMK
ncbi:hypothetical protein M0R19_04985 [Candidatus Pacearchaeota archaeon]|jgi:hypothetical protein|nr:hypothetical protein [Candidatus Pacearchaeota archaeon]